MVDWSSEADEIYRICSVIGSPSHQSWSDGMKLAASLNFQFPQVLIGSPRLMLCCGQHCYSTPNNLVWTHEWLCEM